MRPLLILAIAASAAAADPPRWAQDFVERRAALGKELAPRHVELGKKCDMRRLHAVARAEYFRALELDPEGAGAHLALGHTKVEGSWFDNPEAGARGNDLTDRGLAEALGRHRAARRVLAMEAVPKLERLAEWADAHLLEAEALATWREILLYDDMNAGARAATGWVERDGTWISAESAAVRAAARARVEAAKSGWKVGDTTPLEEQAGWVLTKYRTDAFDFQGFLPESEMREVVKSAEAARALFLERFEVPASRRPVTIRGVFVRNQKEHVKFLELQAGLTSLERDLFRAAPSWSDPAESIFEVCVNPWPLEYPKERAVHQTVHFCLQSFAGLDQLPAWLHEGMALWYSDVLTDRAFVLCCGGKDRDEFLQETPRWRRRIFGQVRDGLAPSLRAVLKTDLDAMTPREALVAWSFTDWMLDGRRQELFAFLAGMREGASQGKAMREAFGVKGYDELEGMWRRWVMERY